MSDQILKLAPVQQLPADARAVIAENAVLRQYRTGDLIFDQGKPADGVYALVTGAARVLKLRSSSERVLIDFIPPGQWFGEGSTLDGGPRETRVEACLPTTALFVGAAEFQRLFREQAEFNQEVTRWMCQKIRLLTRLTLDAVSLTLRQRLARQLLHLAEHFPEPYGEHLRLSIPLPQEDLATLLGATRQRVNQILRDWQLTHLVKVEYRHIVLLDLPGLKRMGE